MGSVLVPTGLGKYVIEVDSVGVLVSVTPVPIETEVMINVVVSEKYLNSKGCGVVYVPTTYKRVPLDTLTEVTEAEADSIETICVTTVIDKVTNEIGKRQRYSVLRN